MTKTELTAPKCAHTIDTWLIVEYSGIHKYYTLLP